MSFVSKFEIAILVFQSPFHNKHLKSQTEIQMISLKSVYYKIRNIHNIVINKGDKEHLTER